MVMDLFAFTFENKQSKMLIGISGHMRSGKTTTANALYKTLSEKGHRVVHVNFADSLKVMIAAHFNFHVGLCYTQKETIIDGMDLSIGQVLQLWGTKLREVHPDIFIFPIKKYILEYDFIIIGDLRFENELNFILDHKGVVVRLKSDRKVGTESRSAFHVSETALDESIDKFHKVFDTDVMITDEIVKEILKILQTKTTDAEI
jgi:hypothetical protein